MVPWVSFRCGKRRTWFLGVSFRFGKRRKKFLGVSFRFVWKYFEKGGKGNPVYGLFIYKGSRWVGVGVGVGVYLTLGSGTGYKNNFCRKKDIKVY